MKVQKTGAKKAAQSKGNMEAIVRIKGIKQTNRSPDNSRSRRESELWGASTRTWETKALNRG